MKVTNSAKPASPRPVGVLLRLQIRFEDRLKHQHCRCLRYPVSYAGNAQWPELAGLLLRDENLPHRLRCVRPILQIPRQFPEPAPHAIRLDVCEGLPIHPGRATIAAGLPPGFGEKVLAPHLVDQRVEAQLGFFLSFRMQYGLEFPDLSDPGRLSPVVMPSFLSVSLSNQGSFPPPALPGFRGTTSPSATLPARPAPHGVPVGVCAPPTGLPVLLPSPSSMRAAATTPAEPAGARVVHFPAGGSLPQTTDGSAPALHVSRPARRSLALRPAWSLDHPRRSVTPECFKPCRHLHDPLRLLPAGTTVAGRDSHPLRNGAFPRHAVATVLNRCVGNISPSPSSAGLRSQLLPINQ